ncbi:hypothetical protein [Nitrosomonas sp. wSCUT-2]
MTGFLDGETRPALTLPSRIGGQIHYSEIIFDDPPHLILQAVPDFAGSGNDLAGRGIVWDVFALIDSIKRPGGHQVLTADCGYAPDVYLEERVLISHPDSNTVVWELDIVGLHPALDKTLTGDRVGYVRLEFAREQYEADIRALVKALQQAGRGPVSVTALDSRTHGLNHLLADYPACDSLPVDELEPNVEGGMALERLLELDADEPWPRTPLWPAGARIEFGFFPGKSGHELMRINGEYSGCRWPSHYFTSWKVIIAFRSWLSYAHRAYVFDPDRKLPFATSLPRTGPITHGTDIDPNDFVLLHASDRQRCHDAGRRFAAMFQASLQEGETAPDVTVRYCENFLHAADDGPLPAGDNADH